MQKLLLGILLITAIILKGCTTSIKYNYKYQSKGVDTSFIIMDKRIEQGKKQNIWQDEKRGSCQWFRLFKTKSKNNW